MSTQTHTKREKGQALFLSALMVLSVFAMSAAFAGAAAADVTNVEVTSPEDGEVDLADESAETVEIAVNHDGAADDFVAIAIVGEDNTVISSDIGTGDGTVTFSDIDMSDEETGEYTVYAQSVDDEDDAPPVEDSLPEEFDEGASASLTIVDNSEPEPTESTLTVTANDGDGTNIDDATVTISDENGDVVETGDTSDSSASFELEDGSYTVTIEHDDYDTVEQEVEIDGDENLSIDLTEEIEEPEEGDATDSSFDSTNYSEEAGDIVDFTVNMEHADEAVIVLEDEDGNYWADLHVESGGEDEVNVSFNSYNAGQEGDDAFSTDSEDTQVSVHDEQTITAEGTHINPGAYTLDLYVNEEGESITVEPVDDGDRADVEGLERAYTSELELTEGSIGDSTVGVAPGDADLSEDVEYDDLDVVTTGDEVAEGDYVSVAVDASGIFGYLTDNDDYDDQITFEMEQTNPGTYQSPDTLSAEDDDFEIVENPETDQVFFVLDTDNINTEAGAEYDVTFSVSEDYGYADEDTESTTSFSVVDRSVEVTGDFDDEDVLQVEQGEDDENSTITGESSIAPGSEVDVELGLGAPDYPTLTETEVVQDDGTIEADFDLSDREVGEELDVTIEDNNSEESDNVTAVLVESADDHDQDPHTVTITVNDADGEPVEDADVEIDGQTETTDSNGEAVFELHHGEYDVSATYDGEEATGSLTVDDESPDAGSLTLGEEDAGDIGDADDETEADDDDDAGVDDDDDAGVDDDDAGVDDDDAADADDGADADDDDDPEDEEQPGFGIAVALIALLAAAGIALRNRA